MPRLKNIILCKLYRSELTRYFDYQIQRNYSKTFYGTSKQYISYDAEDKKKCLLWIVSMKKK